jgi:hypothetical protein
MAMLCHQLCAALLALAKHSFHLIIYQARSIFGELTLLAKVFAKKHWR